MRRGEAFQGLNNDIHDLAHMANIASRCWRALPVSIAGSSEGRWPNRLVEFRWIVGGWEVPVITNGAMRFRMAARESSD